MILDFKHEKLGPVNNSHKSTTFFNYGPENNFFLRKKRLFDFSKKLQKSMLTLKSEFGRKSIELYMNNCILNTIVYLWVKISNITWGVRPIMNFISWKNAF